MRALLVWYCEGTVQFYQAVPYLATYQFLLCQIGFGGQPRRFATAQPTFVLELTKTLNTQPGHINSSLTQPLLTRLSAWGRMGQLFTADRVSGVKNGVLGKVYCGLDISLHERVCDTGSGDQLGECAADHAGTDTNQLYTGTVGGAQ